MNDILAALSETLEARKNAEPESSYVASLHQQGLNKILEKVGEEATEVVLAAKDANSTSGANDEQGRDALVGEVADLWFHSLVLLSHLELGADDVLQCLARRFGISGHIEKAARSTN